MKKMITIPGDFIKKICIAFDEQCSISEEVSPFVFYCRDGEIVHTVRLVATKNLSIDRMINLQNDVRRNYAMDADTAIFISTAQREGELGIYVSYENLDLPQVAAFLPIQDGGFDFSRLVEDLNAKREVKHGGFAYGWL